MIHMRQISRPEFTQQLIKKMAPPLGELLSDDVTGASLTLDLAQ